MAITVAINREKFYVDGVRKHQFGTLTFDNSYDSGGDALDYQDLDFEVELHHLQINPSGGFVAEWDETNNKVLVYQEADSAGPLEEVAATDADTVAFKFHAIGN